MNKKPTKRIKPAPNKAKKKATKRKLRKVVEETPKIRALSLKAFLDWMRGRYCL
jgi:hypothetical protein